MKKLLFTFLLFTVATPLINADENVDLKSNTERLC